MNAVYRLLFAALLTLCSVHADAADTPATPSPAAETPAAKPVVVLPHPLEAIKPKYPKAQLDAGLDGYAVLEFDVTLKGKVENIRVVRSLGEDFEKEAIKAVKHTRFSVGTVDGVPTRMRASLKVRFELEEEKKK